MRKLRPFWSRAEERRLYSETYDHTRWPEHVGRVEATIDFTQKLIDEHELKTVVDLSCGDGAIVDGLNGVRIVRKTDVSSSGMGIEATLMMSSFDTDLFICTETIEHMRAPWTTIELIAENTRFIVLSTPLNEGAHVDNYEHYWSFTDQDVDDMLKYAGFTDLQRVFLSGRGWTYDYQLWSGRRNDK